MDDPIITPAQAAAICRERLKIRLTASYIIKRVTGEFCHLGVFKYDSTCHRRFLGIHSLRWKNFLSGRNHSRTAAQLFNTNEAEL